MDKNSWTYNTLATTLLFHVSPASVYVYGLFSFPLNVALMQHTFLTLIVLGGGGSIGICDAKFRRKKCPCLHNNNTALKKNKYPCLIPCLSPDKYLKFQFKIRKNYFLTNKEVKTGLSYPNTITVNGIE